MILCLQTEYVKFIHLNCRRNNEQMNVHPTYTAVSTKVVQKERKSERDNAER